MVCRSLFSYVALRDLTVRPLKPAFAQAVMLASVVIPALHILTTLVSAVIHNTLITYITDLYGKSRML